MSNSIVLRRVYALDSNTNEFLSSGKVLLTNSGGGTNWIDILSSLTITGGPIVGNLPSTLSTQYAIGYYNTSTLIEFSSIFTPAICSMSTALATQFPGQLTAGQLISSVAGLGDSGYISTTSFQSTLSSFQTYTAPSPSTMSSLATTLASYGYVSTSGLVSTVDGLGETYTSTLGLVSTVMGLATVGYISSLSVTSSIQGLGSSSYVSTASLVSTTTSLLGVGTTAGNFVSTTAGLGQLGYVSTLGLNYTVNNLGTVGYVSTLSLVSTTLALSTQKANIRFDNTGSVTVIDSVNTFTTTGSIIYVSTFFTSSIPFVGNTGTQFAAQVLNNSNLRFSTATLNFSGISSFVDSNSRVTIDIYPHIAFSKLATGANNVAILPISTFLQYGQCNLLNTTVNSYLYAGNTYMIQSNTGLITYVDASNFFNSPIKMSLPQGTLTTTGFTNPYTVVHYMPGGLNYTPYLNALHNCNVTPYFGSTNSLFISVQNIV